MVDFVRALFRRLFVVSFAFVAACLAVPIFMAVIIFFWEGLSKGEWYSPSFKFMSSVEIIILATIFYFTLLITLVPSMLLVAIAEAFNLRNPLIYAIGGGLLGLAAIVFFILLDRSALETRPLMFMTGAGIVAGLVYWRIAGRNAGAWRKLPRPHPQ